MRNFINNLKWWVRASLRAGVSDVVTSTLLPTWLMMRDRCHWCWTYVVHTTVGDVPLTLVLKVNGHLHYPDDIDRTLNETTTGKILQYRTDYNNRPSHSISFMSVITSTSGSLHGEFVFLLCLQFHPEQRCNWAC